ncbi:MAG: thioredoxin domain-containing protein [Saprospiraceae bacterium]|nr:thioredoxin domain-containing protein [Saprospiraceae bacterium]
MNHLIHETSPYLLQHAHNPVDWYAWKPEAFERAKREDKPILVSIGYSTCHWCHVMERESFENQSVAEVMNENFICIKVDREERPDVDQIYMEACQIISGGGGWPLNCFLTPDGRPFFAGTYYPPQSAYGRPSWLQVLHNMANAFGEKRQIVEEQADKLTQIIRDADKNYVKNDFSTVLNAPNTEGGADNDFLKNLIPFYSIIFSIICNSVLIVKKVVLVVHPNFLERCAFNFYWIIIFIQKMKNALAHAELSLIKMIQGGIYDQLGGGFARYATDRAWLVPHFEKCCMIML